jgi:chemotaxis protein MotB
MTRRRPAPKENHDRWFVSYADLVTLLFAFFVVMFASTQSDHVRAKQISQAVEKALKSGSTPPKIAAILGGAVDDGGRGDNRVTGPAAGPQIPLIPDTPLKDLPAAVDLLRSQLRTEIDKGAVEIRVEERGVIIGLNSAIFFSLGDDTIDPHVAPTLAKVAAILNRLPNSLRLEGHTDSLPIDNARFHNNWELSAARSIAMLRLLNERYGVTAQRMAIVGYADTMAADSNETEQGRSRNRRVDIVIVSAAGQRAEPTRALKPTADLPVTDPPKG